jgi:hypothetical protein
MEFKVDSLKKKKSSKSFWLLRQKYLRDRSSHHFDKIAGLQSCESSFLLTG